MKKNILAAVAVIAAIATPMAAQAAPYSNSNRLDSQIQNDINRGLRQGKISNSEARNFRSQLNQIDRLENQYQRSDRRYTQRERADINRRLSSLNVKVQKELRDNGRWDRNDRHDRNDRNHWNRR